MLRCAWRFTTGCSAFPEFRRDKSAFVLEEIFFSFFRTFDFFDSLPALVRMGLICEQMASPHLSLVSFDSSWCSAEWVGFLRMGRFRLLVPCIGLICARPGWGWANIFFQWHVILSGVGRMVAQPAIGGHGWGRFFFFAEENGWVGSVPTPSGEV